MKNARYRSDLIFNLAAEIHPFDFARLHGSALPDRASDNSLWVQHRLTGRTFMWSFSSCDMQVVYEFRGEVPRVGSELIWHKRPKDVLSSKVKGGDRVK